MVRVCADGSRDRRLSRACAIGILVLVGAGLGGCVGSFGYTVSSGYGYGGSCAPVYYGPSYSVGYSYSTPVCAPRYGGYYRGGGACGW